MNDGQKSMKTKLFNIAGKISFNDRLGNAIFYNSF